MNPYINIYKKTYFTLLSEARKRMFRFVRYTGDNYLELSNYIHGFSQHTQIWDEDKLQKGACYGYSGRTFEMHEIHEWEIRCCIVNNPVFVSDEDGKTYPLKLTRDEAFSYLQKSPKHRVFAYEEMLYTFSYDTDKESIMVFNIDHPNGLSKQSLPEECNEWYICCDDGIQYISDIKTKYERFSHIVDFDYGFREKADKIIDLIYEINKYAIADKPKKLIFIPSWEYAMRYKILYDRCFYKNQFREFVTVLYTYMNEETKEKKESRALLPKKFQKDEFLLNVYEFRNYYSHGQAEYETIYESGTTLFRKYINVPYPRDKNDYENLKRKLLDGFIEYLNRLRDYCFSKIEVGGIISVDNNENVYCGDILLPKTFISWNGCKCCINSKKTNTLQPLNKYYKYYAQFPIVIKDINGVIEESLGGDFHYKGYELGDCFGQFYPSDIIIKEFTMLRSEDMYDDIKYKTIKVEIPQYDKKNIPIEQVGDVFYIGDIRIDILKSGIPKSDNISSITLENKGSRWVVCEIKQKETDLECGIIELDENGVYHIGDVALHENFARWYIGRKAIVKEKKPNTNNRYSYRYFSNNVEPISE